MKAQVVRLSEPERVAEEAATVDERVAPIVDTGLRLETGHPMNPLVMLRCMGKAHGQDAFFVPRRELVDAKGRYRIVSCPRCQSRIRAIPVTAAFEVLDVSDDNNAVVVELTTVLSALAAANFPAVP